MRRIISVAASLLLPLSLIAQIPLNGLVAYYPFNGNADDMSGNDFHGSVKGATLAQDRFGNEKSAYLFEDSLDVIVLDSGVYPTNIISISAWVKRLGDGDDNWGFEAVVGGDCGTPYLAFESACIGFGSQCADPIEHYFAETRLEDQDWHHITGIFDGDSISVYMDNDLVVSFYGNGGWFVDSMQIGIGAAYGHWRSTENFYGIIDDVLIYNRALTMNEVESLYREDHTSLKDFKSHNLTIYPNPVDDILFIETGQPGQYVVQITSFNGKELYMEETEKPFNQLDLSSLQNGVYFITIKSRDFVTTRKIVKL